MSKDDLMETLETIQFLQDMSPEYIARIADSARIVNFRPHDVVFREGDPAKSVYLIVSGSVMLEVCAAGIGCKQILTLGPGELLGWSPLLGQSAYTARARTPQAACLVQIDAAPLLKACDSDPCFGFDLMRRTALALAKRLSATRIQFVNVYGDVIPVGPEEDEAK